MFTSPMRCASPAVTAACKAHGGFYLGSIGGPAARLAKDCIKKVDVLEYPELGMEAVWKIEVVDFPAFIVVDDKGNDFFRELNERDKVTLLIVTHEQRVSGIARRVIAMRDGVLVETTDAALAGGPA